MTMDPSTTLALIRGRVATLRGARTNKVSDLTQAFDDLDAWLSSGGFLPRDWSGAATAAPGRPRAAEEGTVLDGVAHGTRRAYNQGCHCQRCRAANRLKRNLTPTEMENFDV